MQIDILVSFNRTYLKYIFTTVNKETPTNPTCRKITKLPIIITTTVTAF